MSGRKCETCFKKKLGYCPFDNACEFEVWELFVIRNVKKNVEKKECVKC
jgi:hypothetical protein